MKKKITVTQGDIERGIPCRSGECPVSVAMQRAFKSYCKVGTDYALVFDRNKEVKHSAQVRNFIRRFDAGKKVKPFSFEVEL